MFRYDLRESVLYVGRAVAALAADRGAKQKSGTVQFVGTWPRSTASPTWTVSGGRDSTRSAGAARETGYRYAS